MSVAQLSRILNNQYFGQFLGGMATKNQRLRYFIQAQPTPELNFILAVNAKLLIHHRQKCPKY